MGSRKTVLEILGAGLSEVGVFVLWQLLGIIPTWSAYVLFAVLGVAWLVVYLAYNPKQSEAGRKEKPAANVKPLSQSQELRVGIEPAKQIFRRGERLFFKMRFKGTLHLGYRAAQAEFSDKTRENIYDHTTLPNIYADGSLDGPQDFDEKWYWEIPKNAPIGHCKLFIAPCTTVDEVPLRMKLQRWPLRQKDFRRLDLAKPLRVAIDGKTIKIRIVE